MIGKKMTKRMREVTKGTKEGDKYETYSQILKRRNLGELSYSERIWLHEPEDEFRTSFYLDNPSGCTTLKSVSNVEELKKGDTVEFCVMFFHAGEGKMDRDRPLVMQNMESKIYVSLPPFYRARAVIESEESREAMHELDDDIKFLKLKIIQVHDNLVKHIPCLVTETDKVKKKFLSDCYYSHMKEGAHVGWSGLGYPECKCVETAEKEGREEFSKRVSKRMEERCEMVNLGGPYIWVTNPYAHCCASSAMYDFGPDVHKQEMAGMALCKVWRDCGTIYDANNIRTCPKAVTLHFTDMSIMFNHNK